MKSEGTEDFWRQYHRLPLSVRIQARRAYHRFRNNPNHPGLRFKHLGTSAPWYSARVSKNYRVVGLLVDDVILWVFIGTHAEYDHFLETLD